VPNALRFWVYLIRCGDGSLYCGITNDLKRRLAMHEAGKGARYTRGRGPLVLVYKQRCADRSKALQREHAVKQLSRTEKEALIAKARARPKKAEAQIAASP
jgi:predicted GIY-YIG superfamily endonuclease